MNIAGYAVMIKEKNIEFSNITKEEIDKMQKVCDDLMVLVGKVDSNIVVWHSKVVCMKHRRCNFGDEAG